MSDRVLLIGAAGLVGRHVRAALAHRDVIETFHNDPVDGGVDAVQLDLTDSLAVRRLIERVRPTVVVLAAADPSVEGCERDPSGTRRVNVEAAAAVRNAAPGATLVVFSSEYVFDGRAGTYREDDAVAPLNVYGLQKVALEEIARSSPRHLVLRVSGVFGKEPRRKNFVWQLVDRLRDGGTFDVPSDQLITPTDATSLGTVLRELLDRGATGTFHAAGPEILGRVAFAKMVARAFGLDESRIRARPTAELNLKAKRPEKAGLADAKLRALLGHGLRRPEDALAGLAGT
jgi:dTDP-4-dehydrorhamnose reductase